jgi:hypothetical protein
VTLRSQLRRDHIDEEYRWIQGTLGASRTKLVKAEAHAVDKQWAFYLAEQRRDGREAQGRGGSVDQRRERSDDQMDEQRREAAAAAALTREAAAAAALTQRQPIARGRMVTQDGATMVTAAQADAATVPPTAGRDGAAHNGNAHNGDAHGGVVRGGDDHSWIEATACAEGAMILTDLRSHLARCVLCAWFNEWQRFSERDQVAPSDQPPILPNAVRFLTPTSSHSHEHDSHANATPPTVLSRQLSLRMCFSHPNNPLLSRVAALVLVRASRNGPHATCRAANDRQQPRRPYNQRRRQ